MLYLKYLNGDLFKMMLWKKNFNERENKRKEEVPST